MLSDKQKLEYLYDKKLLVNIKNQFNKYYNNFRGMTSVDKEELLADCTQQIYLKLLQKMDRFDPSKGYNYVTYASFDVRQELQYYFSRFFGAVTQKNRTMITNDYIYYPIDGFIDNNQEDKLGTETPLSDRLSVQTEEILESCLTPLQQLIIKQKYGIIDVVLPDKVLPLQNWLSRVSFNALQKDHKIQYEQAA